MRRQMRQKSGRFKSAIWVVVAGVIIVAGCNYQSIPQADRLAIGPDLETLAVRSEHSGQAIEAAGGLDAWANAREIEFDCVTAFYQEDGTFYLTEQRYEVFPWSNSIRVSGREPSGEYSWQLQRGLLEVLRGESSYDGLQVGVDNACIAEGILSVITAPVRLLDEGVDFEWSSEMVKLEGQWYKPVKRIAKADAQGTENLRDASFYQRRSVGRVDMALLRCGGPDGVLIVRGHDYKLLGKGGVIVPSRIEAFIADATGRVRHRIIQIDIK